MDFFNKRSDWPLLALLALMLVGVKAWLTDAAGFDLYFDEAHYWTWSRQLDWSYYSKGPLIAWLIALSEHLFGHGEWQVRLFGWLAHGAFLTLLFAFAKDVWRSRAAAWWAFGIALLTPLYFFLGLAMTTDNLLLLFWTWGLWAVYRALFAGQGRAWYEAGAAVGLGALTKLSIGLLPALVGLWILLRRDLRHHLKTPYPWIALLLMAALMSPLIWWNAHHDWVMLRHELGHVENSGWSPMRAMQFVAGQLLVLSPIVATVAAIHLGRAPKSMPRHFLWLSGLTWTGFFVFKASGGEVEVNWAAPSYIGLLILFAGAVPKLSRARRHVLRIGLAVSVVGTSAFLFPQLVGMSANELVPIRRVKMWHAPIEAISRESPGVQFILAPSYQIAAEFAFYWPTPIPVYLTGDRARRFNQHDLWPGVEREAGHDGLYVSLHPDWPNELNQAFERCTRLAPRAAVAADGSVVRVFYMARCNGYRPINWPKPQRY